MRHLSLVSRFRRRAEGPEAEPRARHRRLALWQADHLQVQWVEASEPWLTEASLIEAMAPPLNRDHNQAHPFYAAVGEARHRLDHAARTGK